MSHAGHRAPESDPCPVEGCTRQRPGMAYVMCSACWALVPREEQHAVYRTWGARVRAHHEGPAVDRHEQAKATAVATASRARMGGQTSLEI